MTDLFISPWFTIPTPIGMGRVVRVQFASRGLDRVFGLQFHESDSESELIGADVCCWMTMAWRGACALCVR